MSEVPSDFIVLYSFVLAVVLVVEVGNQIGKFPRVKARVLILRVFGLLWLIMVGVGLELLLREVVFDALLIREGVVDVEQIILAILVRQWLPSRKTLR